MQLLLSDSLKIDVIHEPFPHIIVNNVLPEELYLKLASEFPPLHVITQTKEFTSNQRCSYLAHKALSSESISPLWKQFIQTQVSQAFLNQFTNLFANNIEQIYPNFEKDFGALPANLKAGIAGIDNHANADVLLDLQLSVNTPVFGTPSSVRLPHVDLPNKLFVGLFYMRRPEDDSIGGDLEIYKFKNKYWGKYFGWKGQYIDEKYIETVKTIKYEPNKLVLFLNSTNSLHGVTVRSITNIPRQFLFLAGVVKKPLFDILPNNATATNKLQFLKRKLKKLILTVAN